MTRKLLLAALVAALAWQLIREERERKVEHEFLGI